MREQVIVRRLYYGAAVTAFGDGLWFSLWVIFLTKIQSIPAGAMGLAMGLGGVVGLLAASPAGALADRRGPRGLLAVLILARGLIMVGYLFVGGFWSLLLVASLFAAAQSAGAGVRVALISGLMPADRRLPVLARSRVVQHIAYSVGAGLAGVVLAVGTREAFVAAVVLNAVTFFATAALTLAMPAAPPVPTERLLSSTKALRDGPFVAIMATTAVLALCWSMLSSGLPLWVHNDTVAPQWISAAAVVLSSVLIVLFQIPVSQRAARIGGAVRSTTISGVALAACCVIFALSALPRDAVLAVVVIVIGVGAHVVGELYYMAARWGLSLRLMNNDAVGQYQGVVATTEVAVQEIGPAVVILLIAGWHGAGWLVLGLLLAAITVPTNFLVRKALRSRNSRHADPDGLIGA